jgi:hypothetical protein
MLHEVIWLRVVGRRDLDGFGYLGP